MKPSNSVHRDMLEALYRCLHSVLNDHEAVQRSNELTPRHLLPPATQTGLPGRPRYNITSLQISHCISIGIELAADCNILWI